MTEYFVRIPHYRVGRDYQARPAGEEFIVAMCSPRHYFNIGDHVWMAMLMTSIADYVKTHLGREAVFEFPHQRDQEDINDLLGQCLGVSDISHSDYKGKYAKLGETSDLLYPGRLRTRCVFDRLGGEARRELFIEKESWPVVMTRGLRHGAEMIQPLTGMISAWAQEMKFKAGGFERSHAVAAENYRAPDLIIQSNQHPCPEFYRECLTVDLCYDDLPFFRHHLQKFGNGAGKLDRTVFDRAEMDRHVKMMEHYGVNAEINMIPVQPVAQLWAQSVRRVLREAAVRHGVQAPEFALSETINSPLLQKEILAVTRNITAANINYYPLCVIQGSTSMKSKNPPMELLMQEAEQALREGMKVVFIGAPGDAQPPENLPDGVYDWVGETSLAESMMLLRHPATRRFISGDSGLAHYLGANQRLEQEMTTFFLSSNPDISSAVSPRLNRVDLQGRPAISPRVQRAIRLEV